MNDTDQKEAKMDSVIEHVNSGGGLCGTCARPANATPENQGYSSCCNDRIEYLDEALETYKRSNCKHQHTTVQRGTAYGLNGHTERFADVVCADCGEYVDQA